MSNHKKHIVFLLDFYYPNYSANGICAKKIIDVLKSEYEVTAIVIKNSEDLPDVEMVYEHRVRRTETKEFRIRNKCKSGLVNSNSKFKKILYKGLFRFVQLIRYVHSIFAKENTSKSLIKAYIKELRKIDNKIDLIIPLCYPFESIMAALQYKNEFDKSVIILPYLFDNFSQSQVLHRTKWNKNFKMNRHLLLEKKMFRESNYILASWDWEKNIEQYFNEYLNKVTYVDIPALCEVLNYNDLMFELDKIHLVYTGALNKTIRPPEYTLRMILKCLDSISNIVFHMYIAGNCEAIVNEYVDWSDNKIINHGTVGVETVQSALFQSNVLVSIGNTDIGQIPSKIYEYMASGKPIIHLYHDINDPVIKLLKQYELACCLSQTEESFDLNVEQMIEFIYRHYQIDRINYSEIKRKFITATPEYTADILRKIISLV
jgi:glycosyltransferase involved in cell wall biosynthesis